MREKVYKFPYALIPKFQGALEFIAPLQKKNAKFAADNRDKIKGYPNLPVLVYALEVATSINILTQEFFEFIIKYNPEELHSIASALGIARDAGLLSYEEKHHNVNAIINHADIVNASCCLEIVYKKTPLLSRITLAQTSFNIILKHKDLKHLPDILTITTSRGLLGKPSDRDVGRAKANFDIITGHQNPECLKTVLQFAKTRGFLLKVEQFYYLTALRPLILEKISAILLLKNIEELLTGPEALLNFNKIILHENIQRLQSVLKTAHELELLKSSKQGQANFDAIVHHTNLRYLGLAISSINNGGMLTREAKQNNFEAIATHPNLPALVDLLIFSANAKLFSEPESGQKNFMEVIAESKKMPPEPPKNAKSSVVRVCTLFFREPLSDTDTSDTSFTKTDTTVQEAKHSVPTSILETARTANQFFTKRLDDESVAGLPVPEAALK